MAPPKALLARKDRNGASRGVVCTGAVGSLYLGWSWLFRYELRCWRGGSIPDQHYAVGGAQQLPNDPPVARRVLDCAGLVPAALWGRDELGAGEMWNSNSVIAWLIAGAGIATEHLGPPPGGRAPGWQAGVTVAARSTDGGGPPHPRRPRVPSAEPA